MRSGKVEFYEAKDGWRWRAIASNGKIVAESGEAYTRKLSAKKGAKAACVILWETFFED